MRHLFVLLILVNFFSSCEECSDKPVTCSAYQEKGFSAWFPYSANNRLIFSSTSGNDTFTIKSVYTSNSYEDRVSARSPFCNAEKTINSVETINFGADKLNILNAQYNDAYAATQSTERLNIYIKNGGFTGSSVSDTGIVKNNATQNSQFFSSLSIGGTSYTKVQLIVADTFTTKTSRPYKLWISRNIGIVAYEDYPSKTLWIKQ